MKLYHSPGACSMACHIALEETGTDFQPVAVRLSERENLEPAYLAVHPRGYVPLLELDDGRRLTEAIAILLHVARRHPAAELLPDAGTVAEARVFEWLAWLTNTVHVAYAGLWRPERFTDDPAAREALAGDARKRIEALSDQMVARLGGASYAAGETYTLADPFLLVFFYWANRIGLDPAGRYPVWASWARRVEARPAVTRVLVREGVSLWR